MVFETCGIALIEEATADQDGVRLDRRIRTLADFLSADRTAQFNATRIST